MAHFVGRELILSRTAVPQEEVYVPEWDGSVIVVGLTSNERDALENSIMEQVRTGKTVTVKRNLTNFRGKFLAIVIRDQEGKRLFSDADAQTLGNLPAGIVERLVDVAQRLSGITEEDVESLVKNSESGPSDDSVSS